MHLLLYKSYITVFQSNSFNNFLVHEQILKIIKTRLQKLFNQKALIWQFVNAINYCVKNSSMQFTKENCQIAGLTLVEAASKFVTVWSTIWTHCVHFPKRGSNVQFLKHRCINQRDSRETLAKHNLANYGWMLGNKLYKFITTRPEVCANQTATTSLFID